MIALSESPALAVELTPSSACLVPASIAVTAGFALNALHHLRNFFRCGGGAFGELTNFIGDDCEAASLFTRACRFNRGVQRQQVGLIGDVVDHADNVPDLIGALA